jgi:hypothetical protein
MMTNLMRGLPPLLIASIGAASRGTVGVSGEVGDHAVEEKKTNHCQDDCEQHFPRSERWGIGRFRMIHDHPLPRIVSQ